MPHLFASAARGAALDHSIFTASPSGAAVDSTLVLGEKKALLIDAQFTVPDARRLVDLIVRTGRELETVDLVYNGTHLWTKETTAPEAIEGWRASLDRLEKVGALIVVPGHQADGAVNDPRGIAHTRRYLDAWQAALAVARTADELVAAMKERVAAHERREARGPHVRGLGHERSRGSIIDASYCNWGVFTIDSGRRAA